MGLFICFEGGEGSGKSTQVRSLRRKLNQANIPNISIREPGGTQLGDKLRKILMFSKDKLTPETELLLFNASRAHLVDTVIKPALEEGKVVLCDRFESSTLAYQGYGRGVALETIDSANMIATRGIRPDLNIFLDILPEQGFDRLPPSRDRFESEGVGDFHRRVRIGYLDIINRSTDEWLVIDAMQSTRKIADIVWDRVKSLLIIS